MSLALAPQTVKQGAPEGTATIQKLLDENSQLIARIKELQAAVIFPFLEVKRDI